MGEKKNTLGISLANFNVFVERKEYHFNVNFDKNSGSIPFIITMHLCFITIIQILITENIRHSFWIFIVSLYSRNNIFNKYQKFRGIPTFCILSLCSSLNILFCSSCFSNCW